VVAQLFTSGGAPNKNARAGPPKIGLDTLLLVKGRRNEREHGHTIRASAPFIYVGSIAESRFRKQKWHA